MCYFVAITVLPTENIDIIYTNLAGVVQYNITINKCTLISLFTAGFSSIVSQGIIFSIIKLYRKNTWEE